jgi:hypothetical protein
MLMLNKRGPVVSFAVRYPKGRKPFDRQLEALAFAEDQRGKPEGWAEVSRVTTEIIQKKR